MSKALVCTNCGYFGKAKTATKGSMLFELVLWMVFVVPGIIYSFWRMTSRHKACPKCGNTTMIPSDSPMGRKALKDLGVSEATIQETEAKAAKADSTRKIVIAVCLVIIFLSFYALMKAALDSGREKARESKQASEQVVQPGQK